MPPRAAAAAIAAMVLVMTACASEAGSPAGASGPAVPSARESMPANGEGSQLASATPSLDPTVPRALDVEVEPVTGFIATGLAASDGLMWMTDSDAGVIRSMDTATGAVGPDIAVGRDPVGIAADGDEIWVANSSSGDHTAMRVDGGTGEVTLTVELPAGSLPTGLALTENDVWVGVSQAGTVARIDRATGELLGLIGDEPDTVAAGTVDVLATESAVWVIDGIDGRVLRIDPTTGDSVSAHDDLGHVRQGGSIPASGPTRLAAFEGGVFVLAEILGANDQPAGRIYRIDEATDTVEVVLDLAFSPNIARGLGLPALVVTDAGIWLSAGDRSARIARDAGRMDGVFAVDYRITALMQVDGTIWHAVYDTFDAAKSGLYGVDEAAAAQAAS